MFVLVFFLEGTPQGLQAQEMLHDHIHHRTVVNHINNSIEDYLETSGLAEKYLLFLDRQQSSLILRHGYLLLFTGILGLPHTVMTGGAILDGIAGTTTVDGISDFLFHQFDFYFTLYSPTQTISGLVLVDFEYNSKSLAFDYRISRYVFISVKMIRDVSETAFSREIQNRLASPGSDPNFFRRDPTTGVIFEDSIPILFLDNLNR